MTRDCGFLAIKLVPGRGTSLCCRIGFHFHVVGEARTLCQTCSLPAIGDIPRCRHLECYGFLKTGPDGQRFVDPGYGCVLHEWALLSISECAGCPDYEEARP
jgi:hypothetical protein